MTDHTAPGGGTTGDAHDAGARGSDVPGLRVDTHAVGMVGLRLAALADRLDAALETHGAAFDVTSAAREEVSERVAGAYTAAGAQTIEAIESGAAALRALATTMRGGAVVFDTVEAENVGQLRGVRS